MVSKEVEEAIRYSAEAAFDKGAITALDGVLKFMLSNERASRSEVIYAIKEYREKIETRMALSDYGLDARKDEKGPMGGAGLIEG